MKNEENGRTKRKKLVNIISKLAKEQSNKGHNDGNEENDQSLLDCNKENEVLVESTAKEHLDLGSERKSKRKPEKTAKITHNTSINATTRVKNECDDEYNESSSTIVKVLDSEDDFENLTDKKENKIKNEFEKKKSCPTNDLKNVRCTACNKNIEVKKGKFCRHPSLNTLICKKCFKFYSSGKFTKDEYGVEEFCAWCADGGELICCDFCEKAFCKKCIRRNLGKSKLQELLDADENEKWKCFCCDPSPILSIIKFCDRVMNMLEANKDSKSLYKDKKLRNVVGAPTISERRNILTGQTKERSIENNSEITKKSDSGGKSYSLRRSRKSDDTTKYSEDEEENEKDEEENEEDEEENEEDEEENEEDEEESEDDNVEIISKIKRSEEQSVNVNVSKEETGSKRKIKSEKKNRGSKKSDNRSEKNKNSGNRNLSFKGKKRVGKQRDSNASSDEDVNHVTRKDGKKKKLSSKAKRSIIESDSTDEFVLSKKKKKYFKKLSQSSEDDSSEENSIDDSSSDEDSSEEDIKTRRKDKSKKMRKSVSDSSSSKSSSEIDSSNKRRKRKNKRNSKIGKWKLRGVRDKDTDSESSSHMNDEKKSKGKKRVKKSSAKKRKISEDEDSCSDEDNANPNKKGRKKIRKILDNEKLTEATRHARQLEEERRQRLLERTKNTNFDKPDSFSIQELVLEYGPDGKTPLIYVQNDLVKHLKPHQIEGIKFMYDCTVESVERWKNKEEGGGCILAHVMGLGKTLQIVSLIHTLYVSEHIQLKRVMIICPLNTVLNWETEFEKWLSVDDRLDVYVMNEAGSNHWHRADLLKKWMDYGGILIVGYTMYRNLSQCLRVRNKRLKKIFQECLIDPGPDIVVCDEGHVLRNSKSAISIAMNKVKTRRRIILTGTPLQNNLCEYHCMVSFVKPNLLGTLKEFSNSFTRPIENGQCADSTDFDVKLMKRRCHVLHKMLEGCVQRKDYKEIARFLPPKFEYVIKARISAKQREMYRYYLDTFLNERSGKGVSLFSDYQALMRIWTHPWSLKIESEKKGNLNFIDSDEGSLNDFIVKSGEETTSDEMSWSSSERTSDEESEGLNGSDKASDDGDEQPRNKKAKKKEENNATNKKTPLKCDPDGPSTSKVIDIEPHGDDEAQSSENSVKAGEAYAGNCNSKLRSGQEYKDGSVIEEEKEWYDQFLSEEDENNVELGTKIVLLLEILADAAALEEKVLVFSHSLISLDVIEMALGGGKVGGNSEDWCRGCDYFRMDGSTSPQMRKRWSDIFNDEENKSARLFLISTKAGGVGINLVGASRVIVFDISWNPSHDVQSIFRTYRFGQKKPVFVYRLIAEGTMEEKIYDRQVMKQSMSQRVIDEHQIDRHFSANDLAELYRFEPDVLENEDDKRPTPVIPKDPVLAELLNRLYPKWIVKYHEHDSLLQNRPDEELSEAERKEAWEQWELEKQGILNGPQLPAEQRQQPLIGPGTRFVPTNAMFINAVGNNVTVRNQGGIYGHIPTSGTYGPQTSASFQQATQAQRQKLFERQKSVDAQHQLQQQRLRQQQEQQRLRQQQEQQRLRQQQEQQRLRQQQQQHRLRQQQEQQRLRQQQEQLLRLRQEQEQQRLRAQQLQGQQFLQQMLRNRNATVVQQSGQPNQTVFQIVMQNNPDRTTQQSTRPNHSPPRIIELPPDA